MRIVPSQVVAFIDNALSDVANDDPRMQPEIGPFHAPQLRALIELIRNVPDELMVAGPAEQAKFAVARAAIEHTIGVWQRRNDPNVVLRLLAGNPRLTAITVLRRILITLPDEIPTRSATALTFMDEDARGRLGEDLGAVERAVANGEWKAATVLGGAIVEAMLLWALQRNSNAAINAVSAQNLGNNMLRWSFDGYIDVARDLDLITAETHQHTSMARGFRNLIHPAVEQRRQQRCDRSTAFVVVAAIDRVAADLARTTAQHN